MGAHTDFGALKTRHYPMQPSVPANQEAIEAWNTVLFDKFARFRHVVTTGLGIHGTRALAMHPPKPGWRVVDVGCGFGDTTIDIARQVGPSGQVVGVDAAARFIEAARKEVGRAENVVFEVADVETGVPKGPYDFAFSRMGTMFFSNPVSALRNIRNVLVPGGQLCMVVWRNKEANDCFHVAELIVREILGDPPKGNQVTCGPGPFSMASCDLVSDQLRAAGYTHCAFARSDELIQIGATLDEAVQFALTLGPAGEVVRLAGAAAVTKRDEINQALRSALQRFVRDDGIWAPSSTWIVTATSNPQAYKEKK